MPTGEGNTERMLRVSWKYLNRYGNVPHRDDVRFNVAIREVEIPPDGAPPSEGDYPSLKEVKGENFLPLDANIGISGSARLIQNASYAGHVRWTEPIPTADLREFRVDLPGKRTRDRKSVGWGKRGS